MLDMSVYRNKPMEYNKYMISKSKWALKDKATGNLVKYTDIFGDFADDLVVVCTSRKEAREYKVEALEEMGLDLKVTKVDIIFKEAA